MELLNELSPAEQAHTLGLVYGGFAGWIHPNDPERKVVAKTVNGKLVRVGEDEEEKEEQSLGRLIIFDFDDELLYTDLTKADSRVKKFVTLFQALLRTGNDTVILHSRNSEKEVAKFLKGIGVTAGPTLVPYGSADAEKKKKFIAQKIKEGYKEIHFFERDVQTLRAAESLEATYNKLDISIEGHQLPKLSYNPDTRKKPENKKEKEPTKQGSTDDSKTLATANT